MQDIIFWLERALNLTAGLELKLLNTIIIAVLMWLVYRLFVLLINHQVKDLHHRYHWRKSLSYIMAIAGLFLIGRTWLVGIQSMATFLGLLTAGLAIALRDPLTSVVAWLFIVSQRPFEVGDRIQIGHHSGDVIDLGPLKFTILEIGNWVDADQSTGRIMYVPNLEIFKYPLANSTTGFDYIWHEIRVHITFESNWEKAKLLLQEIAIHNTPDVSQLADERIKKASNRFMIMYKNLTPIVYTRVVEHGVRLTLRYLCQPRRRRSAQEAIWESVLRAFAQHEDIQFAYPTQRIYSRPFDQGEASPFTPPDHAAASINGRDDNG